MDTFFFDRDVVAKQTLQNLIHAGIVEPENAQSAIVAILSLDPKDLLAVLMESHQMAEAKERGKYIFIDWACISQN